MNGHVDHCPGCPSLQARWKIERSPVSWPVGVDLVMEAGMAASWDETRTATLVMDVVSAPFGCTCTHWL